RAVRDDGARRRGTEPDPAPRAGARHLLARGALRSAAPRAMWRAARLLRRCSPAYDQSRIARSARTKLPPRAAARLARQVRGASAVAAPAARRAPPATLREIEGRRHAGA